MATRRDYNQMLKAALEIKDLSQQFIDFAKMEGAGEGGEGEEDLEEVPDEEESINDVPEEEEEDEEEEMPMMKKKNPKHLAIILALKKKMGKK